MAQTIEQVLASRGQGFFQTVGDSMAPLLQNRKSTVVLSAVHRPLRRQEVALYRRPTGEYVLHRVVKVGQAEYQIRGDNRLFSETVPAEWILGVMSGFYPDEGDTYISCESKVYRTYLKTLGLRYARLWLTQLPHRVYRKVFSARPYPPAPLR